MEKFEKEMPHLAVAEIEQVLSELVERNIIALTGSEYEWNRRLLKVAYDRLSRWEKQGGMGWRRVQAAIKWLFYW